MLYEADNTQMPYLHHDQQSSQYALSEAVRDLLKDGPEVRSNLEVVGKPNKQQLQQISKDPAIWPIEGKRLYTGISSKVILRRASRMKRYICDYEKLRTSTSSLTLTLQGEIRIKLSTATRKNATTSRSYSW